MKVEQVRIETDRDGDRVDRDMNQMMGSSAKILAV
jgi:hypothetical protein